MVPESNFSDSDIAHTRPWPKLTLQRITLRTQVLVGDRTAATMVGFCVTQIALIVIVNAIAAASVGFSIAGITQVPVGNRTAATVVGSRVTQMALIVIVNAIATASVGFSIAGIAQVPIGNRTAIAAAFLGFTVSTLIRITYAVAAGKGVAAYYHQQRKHHSHHVLPWFTGKSIRHFLRPERAAQTHVKLTPSQ